MRECREIDENKLREGKSDACKSEINREKEECIYPFKFK